MPDVHVVYHVSLILCFLIPFCTCIFGLTDKYIDVTLCLIFFYVEYVHKFDKCVGTEKQHRYKAKVYIGEACTVSFFIL